MLSTIEYHRPPRLAIILWQNNQLWMALLKKLLEPNDYDRVCYLGLAISSDSQTPQSFTSMSAVVDQKVFWRSRPGERKGPSSRSSSLLAMKIAILGLDRQSSAEDNSQRRGQSGMVVEVNCSTSLDASVLSVRRALSKVGSSMTRFSTALKQTMHSQASDISNGGSAVSSLARTVIRCRWPSSFRMFKRSYPAAPPTSAHSGWGMASGSRLVVCSLTTSWALGLQKAATELYIAATSPLSAAVRNNRNRWEKKDRINLRTKQWLQLEATTAHKERALHNTTNLIAEPKSLVNIAVARVSPE